MHGVPRASPLRDTVTSCTASGAADDAPPSGGKATREKDTRQNGVLSHRCRQGRHGCVSLTAAAPETWKNVRHASCVVALDGDRCALAYMPYALHGAESFSSA